MRIGWLDIAKGLGIVLMIIGHSSIPSYLSRFIWLFHMPLFFISTGWTTTWQQTDFIVFLKKKIRSLVIPFLLYSCIILIVYSALFSFDLRRWITTGWEGYGLWFIPVLFMASILVKSIYSIRNKNLIFVVILSFGILGVILSCSNVRLPWNVSSVPFAVFLIFLGSHLRRVRYNFAKFELWHFLLLFFITFTISQFWTLDLGTNSIIPIIPLAIGALTGTLFIYKLSSWIDIRIRYVGILLGAVGKESYLILAFSQVIIILFNKYFELNPILKYCLLVLILILLICIKNGLNKLFNRSL